MFERKMSSGLSSGPGVGRSNGFKWLGEVSEIFKKAPPTESAKASYSFSGSIIITSTPCIKYLKISNFIAYDFPEPAFAKTTELAFSKLNLSNNTKELLCRFMPYKIPSFELKSKDIKGNEVERGSVSIGVCTSDVHTPMDTEPLSTSFPFMSFDLSSNEGILYGINRHNNSLVLFDRFSLENANSVVFAKAGSGKSYAIKLEILRYLMQGVDVIIIDPENEYEALADSVGGAFLKISLTSPNHLNPFDLPTPGPDDNTEDILRSNVINLVGLLRIMLGGLTPEEDAIIDRALTE